MPILENFYVILGVLLMRPTPTLRRGDGRINPDPEGCRGLNTLRYGLAFTFIWLDNPDWLKRLLRGIIF